MSGNPEYDRAMGRDPSPPNYAEMQAGDMLMAVADDGAKWAEAFCQINPGSDWGLMLGWFCNAIEHSNDVRRWARERAERAQ